MSERLKQSLMSSRSEIQAGLAEAESELARLRERARELEELIALGTATLLAADMITGRGSTIARGAEVSVLHDESRESLGSRAAKV